jgi:hypothetical protein
MSKQKGKPKGKKMGFDDHIAQAGATAQDLENLPRQDLPPAIESARYLVDKGRICRVKKTKDGDITEPLCNFTAAVMEEMILDDGVESTRAFLVQGRLETGEALPQLRVPANRFSGMNWVTDGWGFRAVIRAGQVTRDYLREGIQSLSPDVRQRQVFTHTGWREIAGAWVFLTTGGAVGRDGFEVDLGPELTRYRLPRQADDAVGAMRASLDLLRVAPLRVTAPLWAGIYRAPLASMYPLDLSLWLEGQTGSLKSTLSALYLSHFGDFDRTHLPGAWSSTANQLERRAFVLQDVVYVIDDYAPTGLDMREMETKATRLLRSQGNLAGRGRLRADLSERPAFPPRGLILGTGEQHPPGQSILARTLLIEMERADVNLAALTAAQQQATRLPHAMAGYVGWLGPQMPTLRALLKETFENARARATAAAEHLRVPEALAQLWIGLHCGLQYAEDIGACSSGEAEDLHGQCWEALEALGRAQGHLVEEERPTLRFLKVLLTLATQRRSAVRHRDDEESGPDLLGWQDDDGLYLLPDAAFAAIARFCREGGTPFPTSQDRLRRDLDKEGLLEGGPGRYTKPVRVGGKVRRVLVLKRAAVETRLGEEFPDPLPLVTDVTSYRA